MWPLGARHGLYITPIVDFVVRFNQQHNSTGFPDVFDPRFNASVHAAAEHVCALVNHKL